MESGSSVSAVAGRAASWGDGRSDGSYIFDAGHQGTGSAAERNESSSLNSRPMKKCVHHVPAHLSTMSPTFTSDGGEREKMLPQRAELELCAPVLHQF